ncbi:MAG: PEP-CTERM system TPR-repeat protein PrsT, partial [Pseudomonadales bacterium]
YTDIEHLERAKDFQDEGDLISAVIELKNAASKNPKNPEVRLLLGRIYLKAGNGVAAEKELSLAIALGVTDLNVKLDYYQSIFQQDKFDEVIAQVNPDNFPKKAHKSRAYGLLGNANLGKQNYNLARSQLDKSLSIEVNPDAIAGLIKWYMVNRDNAQAMKYIDQGLESFPNDFNLNLVTADYYRYLKDFDKAIEYYSKSLLIHGDVTALLMRADLYVVQGKENLAQKDLNVILQFDSKNPYANFVFAKLNYRKGDFRAAKSYLDQILSVLPNHFPSLAMAGVVDFQLENYEQAAKSLEKYRTQNPGNSDIERLLAETYIKLGRGENAIALLETLNMGKAQDPALFTLLGTAYLQQNDIAQGKEILESARVLDPQNEALSAQLATLQIMLGEEERATQNLQSILQGESTNKKAEILLLWAFVQSEQFDKALQLINNSINQNPDDAKALFVRGLINQQKSDLVAAEMDFNRALAIDDRFYLAMVGLAEIAIQQEKYSLAAEKFKNVLSVKKDHLGSLLGMALIEKKQGNDKVMVEWLLTARKLRPEMNQPVEAMVSLMVRQAEFEKAESLAAEYLRSYPESPEALKLSASTFLAVKNYTQAEHVLRRYLKLHPQDTSRRMQLIEALRRQPNYDAALAEIHNLAPNNDRPAVVALKARVLLDADKADEARDIIEGIASVAGMEALYYELKGDAQFKAKNTGAAVESYTLAYQASPSFAVLKRLIQIDILNNDLAKGSQRLKEHLTHYPDDTFAHMLLAGMYDHQGKLEDAVTTYNRVLESEPKNVTALNNLALLYYKQGKLDLARSYAESAYKMFPSAEVIDTYGWILVNSGAVHDAVKLLKVASGRLPKNQEIMYHYAFALHKVGKTEELKRVMADMKDAHYLKMLEFEMNK